MTGHLPKEAGVSTGLSFKGDKEKGHRGWLSRPNRAKRRGALHAVTAPKERPSDPVMPWLVRASVDAADEPVVRPPSHALSVRSLCPFCGSNQDPESACCAEWAATTGASLQAPPSIDAWEQVTRQTLGLAHRLNHASHLLVVLLASSLVAMLVARYETAGTVELAADHLPVNHPIGPLGALGKEVPPPQPPEPPRTAPQPEPAVEPKLPPMTVVAAVPPPAEILPPPLESAPIRTGWSAEDVAKWHRLRRGMSRTAVRMIFGYPQWIDRRTTPRTEYWLYTSERIVDGGWIAFFDGEGPVSSWREP